MTNLPTTAVVVCAYTLDRWDDLSASIRSAGAQDPAPDELWLIVDHNDALAARAERELVPDLPHLQVVPNRRKKGLSGARNTALEHVSSDIVVFLDDDAAAEPGWLSSLTEHYADSSVIAVGGVATPRWPAGRDRPPTLPSRDPGGRGELDWVVGCTYQGQPTEVASVRNLMGCNMGFRRDVFDRIGGFSEDLGRVGRTPLGCEETELCIRARAAYPLADILFEPRAVVRHQVSPDRLTWKYLWRRCFAEGVSKAAVSQMVGSQSALATERGYAAKVLPRGVLREVRRGIGRRSTGAAQGWSGAAAIVLALSVTAAGYLRGKAARSSSPLGRAVPRLDTQPSRRPPLWAV